MVTTAVVLPSVLLWPRVVARGRLDFDWCIARRVLATVEALQRAGIEFVEPHSLLDRPIRESQLCLVLDCLGARAVHSVVPTLVENGVPFAACVETGHVGRKRGRSRGGIGGEATWADLQLMASQGITLGTRGHLGLDSTGLAPEVLFHDLAIARHEMGRRINVEPWLLRHCGRSVDLETTRIAADLGYELGLITEVDSAIANGPLRTPVYSPRPWDTADSIVKRLVPRRSRSTA